MNLTIPLALLLACGTVRAEEWVSVGQDEHMQLLVAVPSVRVDGAVRRATTRTIIAPGLMPGKGKHAGTWITELTTLDAFDCVRWVWRQEAQEQSFSDGTGAAVSADHYPEPWQSAPPGSASEAVMNFVCAWKPK